jgi:hypothetical protein
MADGLAVAIVVSILAGIIPAMSPRGCKDVQQDAQFTSTIDKATYATTTEPILLTGERNQKVSPTHPQPCNGHPN